MKIVYFYQYFSTPKGAWGTRVYDFARQWTEQGHSVTVVTSIYAKSDLKATRWTEEQNIDGIRVKILNLRIDNKQSTLRRIWTFLVFAVWSSWYALTLPADVVVASSGPITVGIPGLIARYLRGRKLVFEARDLWPDTAILMGALPHKTAQRLAYWFERQCYRAAHLIVALSPGIQQNIARRYGFQHSISVPNATNLALFGTPVPNVRMPEELSDKKVVIYTGNIGAVNNSNLLFETAKALRHRTDIVIVLIGDGQLKQELVARQQKDALPNFRIYDLMPKNELVAYVQQAWLAIVPLMRAPLLDTSSPNKLMEALAAGLPVIQTTDGWIKSFLEEHQCGFTFSSDDPAALANLLSQLADDPTWRPAMSARASAVARRIFDKNQLATTYLKALTDVFQSKQAPADGLADRSQWISG
ncbi:glycosyltransferase family 4 protein [Larkinella rosea]|uniref:Glycosyltransferase WbuB n=1 Tax=Larkinella rosea TaxID=2025312 RepID=A0A3P1BJ06_9BACT|nr:glycosyltransferase family 4 protein [Larkinella rosea]RRB00886.1 glycosyltransferase WbuB [Larkinella rosea]